MAWLCDRKVLLWVLPRVSVAPSLKPKHPANRNVRLDLQLHGRRDHPNRHPDSALEVLHHMDGPQRLIRTIHILPVP